MKSVVIAILIGLGVGLIIGWAFGHAQPKEQSGLGLGSITKIIGSIAAL